MGSIFRQWLKALAASRARRTSTFLDACCDYCMGVDTLRAVKLPRGRVAVACPPCLREIQRACPAAVDLGVIS